MRLDPNLKKSLRLERLKALPRPERPMSSTVTQAVQVRMTAVNAAARMYKGGFLRGEIDIEEFLACAHDLEEWINGA